MPVTDSVDPQKLPACDLVMKGGITSGVVYPGAAVELGKHHRFVNIGGTSAGAIAAAVIAAAEYGRQTGRTAADLSQLEKVTEQLKQPGFVRSVFQPFKEGAAVFDLLMNVADKRKAKRLRFEEASARFSGSIRSLP